MTSSWYRAGGGFPHEKISFFSSPRAICKHKGLRLPWPFFLQGRETPLQPPSPSREAWSPQRWKLRQGAWRRLGAGPAARAEWQPPRLASHRLCHEVGSCPESTGKRLPDNCKHKPPSKLRIPNRNKSGAPGETGWNWSVWDISLLIKSWSPGSTWNKSGRDQVLRAGANWLQRTSPSLQEKVLQVALQGHSSENPRLFWENSLLDTAMAPVCLRTPGVCKNHFCCNKELFSCPLFSPCQLITFSSDGQWYNSEASQHSPGLPAAVSFWHRQYGTCWDSNASPKWAPHKLPPCLFLFQTV